MNPDENPMDISELLAQAQNSADRAATMIGMASVLWDFRQALVATGFPVEEAVQLTVEYLRLLWAAGVAAAAAVAAAQAGGA